MRDNAIYNNNRTETPIHSILWNLLMVNGI